MKTRRKAMKEEHEVRKSQYPHLPGEIWEKICKLLTTKEVARALGPSCMALHGLPLESIFVTTSLTPSGSRLAFEWMMKHMHGALRVTYIHLPHYSSEFMHQPHKFLDIIRKQGCGILVDLQTLKLDINDTLHDWSMWMNGLLELAPKLIVLELRLIRCPPDLSMMGNLRHLDFNVADISRGLPQCLSHMHCLKTLGLRRSLACSRDVSVDIQLPPSLEYLCLKHFLPFGLTVPQGCHITVAGKVCCLDKPSRQERWTALHPAVTQLVTTMVDERYYWEDSVVRVLPHLEALTLVATGCQLASSDGPSVVPRANELEDLYVESLPGEHLNHLTSLTVAAASICITLPAALRLKRLCICARSKLCLRFESAEETASHLQTFDISFRQLLHGRHMEALQTALQKKDMRLMCVTYGQTWIQHIGSSPRPAAHVCWYRKCGCMCCSECLARSGAAVRQDEDNIDRGRGTPPALWDITADMKFSESGPEEARPWKPSLSGQSPPGSPGSNHSHFCIGDAPSDGDSEHDSDNGGLDYFVPSDSEDSNVYEQYVAEYL